MANEPCSWPGEIPEDLLARIKPELAPDERLIWASRAGSRSVDARLFPRGAIAWTIGVIFIALSCCGGAFGALGKGIEKADVALLTIGSVFAVVAVLLGIGGFNSVVNRVNDWRMRGSTLFALTDRRAIIWKRRAGTSGVEVNSYLRGQVLHVARVELPDGSGNVELVVPNVVFHGRPTTFEGVADVMRVEDVVRRTLIDAGSDRIERNSP